MIDDYIEYNTFDYHRLQKDIGDWIGEVNNVDKYVAIDIRKGDVFIEILTYTNELIQYQMINEIVKHLGLPNYIDSDRHLDSTKLFIRYKPKKNLNIMGDMSEVDILYESIKDLSPAEIKELTDRLKDD